MKKPLIRLIGCALMLCCVTAMSQTTSVADGDWNDPATWDLGVPTSGDVIIADGHEVIYNANHGSANSITISSLTLNGTGSMVWPYSDDADYDTDFTITVTGAVTVASTASITTREGDSGTTLDGVSTTRTHLFNFEGNIANDGTISLGATTSGYPINIDWQDNSFAISGSGTTTLRDVDIEADPITITVTTTGTLNIEETIDLFDGTTLVMNSSTGTINFGSSTSTQANVFELAGDNATFTLTDGTVNVDVNNATNNQQVFLIDALGATVNVDGGTLNIGDLTTTGEGRIRINTVATDFDFNVTGGTINIAELIDFQSATAYMDLNISGGSMYVGTQDLGGEGNSELFNGVLTMTAGTLEFGENLDLDVLPSLSGGALFSVGTNANVDADFQVDFATGGNDWNITSSFTFVADGGLDILAGSVINVQSGATLTIEQEDTDEPNNCMQVFGTLNVDGGTVNVAENALTTLDSDVVQIEDGGVINLNDGTFNIATSVTDGSQNTANFLQLDETTSTLTIGDNTGSASTAVLNIGTSIVAQLSPTTEDLINVAGDDALITINSDGEMNVGGGNIGSIVISADANDTDVDDFHLIVQGGILNISGELDIRSGTGFQMSSGTTNIGLEASGGINDIIFGDTNPTAPSTFEMTGGKLNVGDGQARITIGNENNTPAYGSGTAYHEFQITGGTANINAGLRLRDYNARFVVGGGATLNFDPQANANYDPDVNFFALEAGIVDITGAVNINIIDPYANLGTGEIIVINTPGNTANDVITGSLDGLGSDAIDFSNITWGFGDGTSASNGGNGFVLDIDEGHTAYGNWVVNNPSGSDRNVSFLNGGRSYLVGDVTITAGEFDLGTNSFDDDATDGTFSIGANGTLKLDTDFPGHASDNFGTYTFASGSTVDFDGSSSITNAQVPDGSAVSNLAISGGGTISLSGSATISDSLFLTNGTLAAGSNLTMAVNSVVSRSAGTITADASSLGSNNYIIRYTGTDKSVDPNSDAEWEGTGTQSLVVDLDGGQTLTVTTNALSIGDLSINSGTLTDAGLAHTVSGDLTLNDTYTGTGSISLTGGAASHALSATGTATLSNLIMNDANGAAGDLDMTVTGSLTLTDGVLDIGSGTLTISSGATLSGGSGSTFVAFDGASSSGGLVQTFTSSSGTKDYPIGTSTDYTPFSVTLNSSSSFGTMAVLPVTGGSQFTLDGSNTLDIDYYWLVSDDGGFADVDADYTYNYADSDIRGVEASYISARYDLSSPDWATSDETSDGTDGVDDASNEATLKGVDFTDGHFTAGEEDEFAGVITTYYLISGVSDHDWDNGAHWTNTDGGSTAINRTPGTNSPVIIKGDDVTVNSDGQSAGSITIESDGTIIIDEDGSGNPTTGHSFGTISGTGTLRILSEDTDSPTFPDENGADWSNFLGSSGGTVDYSGNGGYTLPTAGGSYNNLTISSTSAAANTKTLPNEDLTISGDFQVSGGFGTTAAISDDTNGTLSITGNVTVASGDTFTFGSTNNRTMSVTGDVTVEGTMNVANSGSASHSLNIAGSLTSNGTFDMNTGGSTVATTFNSSSNASVTGSGSVDFDRLVVNVGSSQATSLTVDVTTFSVTDQGDNSSESSIEFQNGELIISTGATVVLSNNGDVSIPATSALTLNSGSPTFSLETSSAGDLLLNGGLTVNSGIFNVGNVTDLTTDNSIRYDGTSATLTIDAGTLNVGGAIRPSVTDASAALAFSLTNDGIVSLARNRSTNQDAVNGDAARSEGDFALDNAASSFTMSGTNSILEIVRAEENDGKAISITSAVTTYSVTGGTVKVLQDAHDAFSSNSTNTTNDVTVYSAIPLYNLEIGDGDYEGDFGGPDSQAATELDLQVLNDITINLNDATADNGKFEFYRTDQASSSNNDEWNISVGGDFTVTDGTIQVADGGDGGTLTFNGSGTQIFNTNGETFGDIVMNGSGTLELYSSDGMDNNSDPITISGDWTYTQGTLDQNGNTITITNPITAKASSINGDATFDNLTLSNTDGVTQASGTTSISSSGTLTLSDDVIYDLGDNGLTIANQSGGITFAATADATNMIKVSGGSAAVGLTLTYPDATTSGFVFPVGATINATDYYLPAQIDLTAGGGAGATATVVLVGSQHPQVTDSENALNVYWSVSETGFDDTQTATHTYTYGSVNADLVEGADDTNFLDAVNAGSPTYNWTEGSTTNVSSQVITFTDPGSDNIVGDFTAGVDAAFNAVTVYYSRQTGDWNVADTWSNDDCDEASPSAASEDPPSTAPAVICSGDDVTITTTTGLEASAIQIDGTLTSQVADLTSIGDIDGTGTLAFTITDGTTPTFGSLSSSFTSSGTFQFSGNDYSLPSLTQYHNLIISTSTTSDTIDFANDFTVSGDMTISSGIIDTQGFTASDADGGGTFTISSGAAAYINGTDAIFPSGFNTYTLDATSTANYNGNAQTVLGGITYGNLTLTRDGGDPATKTLDGNIVVVGDLDINRRAELACSSFNVELQGNWDMDTRNNTNFDPGTGTFTFGGGNAQTITFSNGNESEAFNNLTINKSGGSISFSNVDDITVAGDLTLTSDDFDLAIPLTVNGNTTIAVGTTLSSSTTVDFDGDLTINGTFTVPTTVNIGGDLTNNGTYTQASNTLIFDNTTTAQSVTGTTTFNNVTLQKASGVDLTFNNDVTIEGTLSLENEGNVVLSTGDLILASGASVTGNAGGTTSSDFSSSRMIRNGGGTSDPAVIRNATSASSEFDGVYPIGVLDGTVKYTPITVAVTGGTVASGTMSLKSINGSTTDQGSSTSVILNRHFYTDFTNLSGSPTLDVIFQYDDADLTTGESDFLSAYSVRSYNTDGWVRPATDKSNVAPGTNQFGASASFGSDGETEVLDFSNGSNFEWIAGDSDLINPRVYSSTNTNGSNVDCSVSTCDWDDATSWSLSADGSTDDGVIPSSDRAVTILSGTTITLDANTAESASMNLEGTINLGSFNSHSFGEVTGTGTLQIEAANLDTYVDTGSGSTFFGEDGGTVEYNGTSAYTLPTAFTEYNNLSIGGSGNKELGANTLIYGNFSINGTGNLNNAGSHNLELRGSFSSPGGGDFNAQDGTFTFSNTVTASLPSDLTFGTSGSLTLDNFGEKDLTGTLTIENLTINSSSGTFDANSNNINISGNWDNQASTSLLTNPGTVTFNGADAQQVDGDNTFAALTVDLASTNVTVGSGTQTLTGTLTVSNTATLDLGANTIRAAGTIDVDGGTFTASSGTVVYTSTTNGETQTDAITVGTLEIDKGSGNTFDNDPATVTFTNLTITSGDYDGPDSDLSLTGSLTISADGSIDLTGIDNMDIDGDFSNAITLDLSGLTSMNIAGNFTETGTFTPPTTVTFDGAGAQTITGAVAAGFDNLVINNTSSGITASSAQTVSTSLTLTDGEYAGTLNLEDGATISGGSDASYVNGTVARNLSATTAGEVLVFPLGSGDAYRAFTLTLDQDNSATETTYTTSLVSGAPTVNSLGTGLNHVSGYRYYAITQSPYLALDAGTMTIEFNSDDEVGELSTLTIAKDSNGDGNFQDIGNASTTGNSTDGTITSNNFTTFTDAVLASTDADDTLPVELLFLFANQEDGSVIVEWSTATELNNEGFRVQHSTNGINFTTVGFVAGAGSSSSTLEYRFEHKNPIIGTNYYRLQQLDFDGEFVYSETIMINVDWEGKDLSITVYPNPVIHSKLTVQVVDHIPGVQMSIQLIDLNGKVQFHEKSDSQSHFEFDVQSLERGIYFVVFQQNDRIQIQKIVVN